MRPLASLSLLLGGVVCLGVAAQAQQQESRMDKILHPNLQQNFDLDMAKSAGTKSYDSSKTSSSVPLKPGFWTKAFSPKGFLTGAFHGDKSFWLGDFKYTATEANTSARIPFALSKKSYDTTPAAVKTANDAGKQYDARTLPTRDFRGKEMDKFKSHLTPEQAANNGFRGDLTELKSIDDVRALLNKSK